MTNNERRRLYGDVMDQLGKIVRNALDEKFEKPEKTFAEKLFGLEKKYAARVEKAEDEYYAEIAKKYTKRVNRAQSMQELLDISKDMLEDGFKFPIGGMLKGAYAPDAELRNVVWMTADRESTENAEYLSYLEGDKGSRYATDITVLTYYLSWKWWVANIVRCLVFWRDPYGKEANEKIGEYLEKISPRCPIVKKYPEYFKKG